MLTIQKTNIFEEWLWQLEDRQARTKIQKRIDRLSLGHLGDHKHVGEEVFELRVHGHVGYRLYFMRQGDEIVILLAGGDKSTQSRDIASAIVISKQFIGGQT